MPFIVFLLSSLGGFTLNNLVTKPGTRLNKRLPKIRIKFLELSPSLKIRLGKRTIHIHHWLGYSIILVITFTFNTGFLNSMYAQGYLVGSIAQGLTFPDWKSIIKKE